MAKGTFEWIGLDHVQLAAPAGSEEVARLFFQDLLGMIEIPKPEKLKVRGGVWFQCGAQFLHIGIEAAFVPAKKSAPCLRRSKHRSSDPAAKRKSCPDPHGR